MDASDHCCFRVIRSVVHVRAVVPEGAAEPPRGQAGGHCSAVFLLLCCGYCSTNTTIPFPSLCFASLCFGSLGFFAGFCVCDGSPGLPPAFYTLARPQQSPPLLFAQLAARRRTFLWVRSSSESTADSAPIGDARKTDKLGRMLGREGGCRPGEAEILL